MKELGKDVLNLENEMNSNAHLLVEISGSTCGACKLMEPVLVKTEEAFNLNIVKLNIDDYLNLKDKYEVKCLPTLLFFKDGYLVEKLEGYTPQPKLFKVINEKLGL